MDSIFVFNIRPLPPRALKKMIYSSCGSDSSSAVLTQVSIHINSYHFNYL